MIARIRAAITTRVGIIAAAGTGGTAHFCAHPCPEHGIMALIIWIIAAVVAFKGKVFQRETEE